MTLQPSVSVMMTVYNGEKYVSQAIHSIRRQSLADFEFVIVDDGSTDRTPELLAEAQARDSRLKVITAARLGRAKALNLAWREASGAYIANLDADDLAEPARLERQLAYLQQQPDIGLLGTACRVLDNKKESERVVYQPLTDAELRRRLVRQNPFVHSSVMMPRRVLESLGGYNEHFRISVDYELWVRLAQKYRLANLPDVLTAKRVHSQAYFQRRILTWDKCKARIVIRWQAWRALSNSAMDFRFVVLEPVSRWFFSWASNASRFNPPPPKCSMMIEGEYEPK
ncbi:MAG TPA: glycosyltransferase [Anaerolineae bacterium]|nr:glycosyltransferase [Anaerolineae bacterium]